MLEYSDTMNDSLKKVQLLVSISEAVWKREKVHIEVQKYVYISLFNATIQDIRTCAELFLTPQTTSVVG